MRDNTGARLRSADYAPAVDAETTMLMFDELPRVIRQTIARAPFPVASSWALNLVAAGHDEHAIAQAIERQCAGLVDAAYAERGFNG